MLKVARYLSAAFVACEHGAGMDYTRKKYADAPVGRFWIDVARLVIEGAGMTVEQALPVRQKPTIQ